MVFTFFFWCLLTVTRYCACTPTQTNKHTHTHTPGSNCMSASCFGLMFSYQKYLMFILWLFKKKTKNFSFCETKALQVQARLTGETFRKLEIFVSHYHREVDICPFVHPSDHLLNKFRFVPGLSQTPSNVHGKSKEQRTDLCCSCCRASRHRAGLGGGPRSGAASELRAVKDFSLLSEPSAEETMFIITK